jgi:hypothetical protein
LIAGQNLETTPDSFKGPYLALQFTFTDANAPMTMESNRLVWPPPRRAKFFQRDNSDFAFAKSLW